MAKLNSVFILLIYLISKTSAQTVTIGNQVWMTENLNVDKFNNGDPIPQAKTKEEWQNAGKNKQPAWCYYDNNPENGKKYGRLYNWYAINDPRGIVPSGYHLPNDAEWTVLTDYLGGTHVASTKMKNTTGWANDGYSGSVKDGNGSNESKFSALPGGVREDDGSFDGIGQYNAFWSISENKSAPGFVLTLDYKKNTVLRINNNKHFGFSVRCISSSTSNILTSVYSPVKDASRIIENSSVAATYNECTIGNQVWMTENLNEDKFRNGDPIPQAKSTKEWEKANKNKQAIWCYYDNDTLNGKKYGKLYNWYAVNDPRGLAPAGWHIPSYNEWKVFINYYGGYPSDELRKSSNKFKTLMGGSRNWDGSFGEIGEFSYWWSSTGKLEEDKAWYIMVLKGRTHDFTVNSLSKGYSVRCLKD